MRRLRFLILLTAVGLLAPAAMVAAHHNDDHGDNGTIPDMPDPSTFGLCTAYENNEKGRENGNAGNAGPFVWLEEQADEDDESVADYCSSATPGNR